MTGSKRHSDSTSGLSHRVVALAGLAVVAFGGCAGKHWVDIETPRPIPPGSCLVVGFLGGRRAWNDEREGVRRLALRLRSETHIQVETFDNRSRALALEFVRQALPKTSIARAEGDEAEASRIVVYGQSFGGAATAEFARQLHRESIPVQLTVQIDSVGRRDAAIPPNVRYAANLFQREGWLGSLLNSIRGESVIHAVAPTATTIVGNIRFDYSEPPGSDIAVGDLPFWRLAFRVAHVRMDRDPRVWSLVETLVRDACAGIEPAVT